jgi:SAM-dependent methyltransferase
MSTSLRPAALAFDTIAPSFDARFGAWESVSAQRRAVRAELQRHFPIGGRVLEIGGGTGEDATYLAQRGYKVLLTDPSPMMVSLAEKKLIPLGSSAAVAAGEEMDEFAERYLSAANTQFDGAFSNFAPLNCIADLTPVARGLSRLIKPGGVAMLVVFGTYCPGEMIVETLRGRPGQVLRRFKRGVISARLAKHEFQVVYHRRRDMRDAFAQWFVLERRVGIGVAVPPSAAEPWISNYPHLLAAMETADRVLGTTVPMLGDHVLYQLRRNESN